jgi:RNA polymerase sigma factor (sigma-70 family)
MTSASPFELEPASLLSHDQWLRSLARSLVHGTDVDDVVQDTWTAALRQRPDASQPLRGWLATVLRRVASRRHRTDSRRLAREGEPRHEPAPSTEATVALLELQRAVSVAVSSMAEPYRTAVLMRYFHGLGYAGIAARDGIGEAAARKRVERGLELLRAQLQRRDAGWKRAPAMLVLAGPPAFALSAVLGVVAVSQTVKATAVVVVVAALASLVWWLQPPPAVPGGTPVTDPVRLPAQASRHAAALSDVAPTLERVAAASTEVVPVKAPQPWHGRVLDPRGRALAGVPIVLAERLPADHADDETLAQRERLPEGVRALSSRPDATRNATGLAAATMPELGRSAADGGFAVFAASGHLLAGPGWTTLRSPPVPAGEPSRALLLVVTREVSVSGEVVDEAGRPLGGVRLGPDWPVLDGFPEPLDSTTKVAPPFAHSAADGTFRLAGLPAGEGRIGFHGAGFVTQYVGMPDAVTTGLRVVMRLPDRARTVVKGIVVDHREVPVPNALVVWAGNAVHTRADGRFELVFDASRRAPAHGELVAACPGYQTLVVPRFGAELLDPAGSDVVLRLPGAALAISGTVVDHEGKPIADALVYPWDEPFVLEDRTADELGMARDEPAHMAGVPLRVAARTDAVGAFTLRGLRAHGYRLHVLLRTPRAGFTSELVTAPAENVCVRLPQHVVHERVAGRVVDRSGVPVAGVAIGASVAVFVSPGNRYGDTCSRTTTGADGGFELRDVPRFHVMFHLNGDGVVPCVAKLDLAVPLHEQRFVVARRRHLQIELDKASGATAFRVLDATGGELPILEVTPGGSSSSNRWPLQDGRSTVLAVSEDAATVVIENGATELVRLPLTFARGEVTRVRY